ncbi:hypothetical protein [Rhizobium rhizophilum]|nr:hypothetical protein [Rhizobium rhizophilum]
MFESSHSDQLEIPTNPLFRKDICSLESEPPPLAVRKRVGFGRAE